MIVKEDVIRIITKAVEIVEIEDKNEGMTGDECQQRIQEELSNEGYSYEIWFIHDILRCVWQQEKTENWIDVVSGQYRQLDGRQINGEFI